MKKLFLILADLDSTFESNNEFSNEFDSFVDFVEKFEKTFDCLITIHFVSGTSLDNLEERLEAFKYEYPEIYSRIDYSVLSQGKKYNRELYQIGTCQTHHCSYDKSDGVQDIVGSYGKSLIYGMCYIGDGKNDIPAFEMFRFYKNSFPLGAYCLAPRSRRDYYEINSYIDIYSDKPRIIGCVDCLNKMVNKISSKINYKEWFYIFC